MNKTELMREVANRCSADLDVVIDVFTTTEVVMMEHLKKMEPVRVFKGVNIVPKIREGREFLNPKTLDTVFVPAKIVANAELSKHFKDELNEDFEDTQN